MILLDLRPDAEDVRERFFLHLKPVDPDDDPFLRLDLLLILIGALRNLLLNIARFDGLDRTAHRLDLFDIFDRLSLDFVGERLHDIGASQRVDHIGNPAFVGDDLLGSECEPHRILGRQRIGLVPGIGMEGLGSAKHRSHRLKGNPDHIVVGLLRGQRTARRLGMKPQHAGLLFFGLEALLHDGRPEPSGGPEFCDLFDEIVVAAEKERDPGGDGIDIQPRLNRGLQIGDAVGQRERHLLDGGATGLAHVVAADADRIPPGNAVLAEGKDVGDDPHRFVGRKDIGPPGRIFLQDVVLDGPLQKAALHPLFFGNRNVHRHQDRGRRIDRH